MWTRLSLDLLGFYHLANPLPSLVYTTNTKVHTDGLQGSIRNLTLSLEKLTFQKNPFPPTRSKYKPERVPKRIQALSLDTVLKLVLKAWSSRLLVLPNRTLYWMEKMARLKIREGKYLWELSDKGPQSPIAPFLG